MFWRPIYVHLRMPRGDSGAPTRRSAKALSAVVVYDLASAVKDEFEKVIGIVGNEPMVLLVARVVDVLEHLERLTQVLQTERVELEDLRLVVEKLKSSARASTTEKENYQKEKEILEKGWKEEIKELSEYAAKIQEENLVLRFHVKELKDETQDFQQSRQELNRLTEEIQSVRKKMYSQKDALSQLRHILIQKDAEIEALQLQLDRFTELNTTYRNRYSASNRQIQKLLDEKAELEGHVPEKSPSDAVQFRKKRAQNGDNDGAVKATSRYCRSFGDYGELLLDEDAANVDNKNPDEARYSQIEMTKMLEECKELKLQLMEAKDELAIYRPELRGDGCDDDHAVQGPINEEPEEKLFPEKFQKPTVIQKLFENLSRVLPNSPQIKK